MEYRGNVPPPKIYRKEVIYMVPTEPCVVEFMPQANEMLEAGETRREIRALARRLYSLAAAAPSRQCGAYDKVEFERAARTLLLQGFIFRVDTRVQKIQIAYNGTAAKRLRRNLPNAMKRLFPE